VKNLSVKITQKHINKGIRNNGEYCPIALALKEQYKLRNKQYWFVSSIAANICKEAHSRFNNSMLYHKRYSLPSIAKNFLDDFDIGKLVKPIIFELKVEETW